MTLTLWKDRMGVNFLEIVVEIILILLNMVMWTCAQDISIKYFGGDVETNSKSVILNLLSSFF